jgi:hypothetical protein
MVEEAHDFNVLERCGQRLIDEGRHQDALTVYLYMADGDPSLDAGHLGARIGECYTALGQPYAAKYWFGRAVDENPVVNAGLEQRREQIGPYPLSTLIQPQDHIRGW